MFLELKSKIELFRTFEKNTYCLVSQLTSSQKISILFDFQKYPSLVMNFLVKLR